MTVVPLVLTEYERAKRAEDARALRDYADMVEKGTLAEFVLVGNDTEKQCFFSYGSFTDRWRILGALEYARYNVCRQE